MDYDEIDCTLRRLYREGDYDAYNTLQCFAVFTRNKELVDEGLVLPEEVSTTYADDVKACINAHIEGDYTNCLDAVY
jgi:hypothetical protein